jgi:hypothetical protein
MNRTPLPNGVLSIKDFSKWSSLGITRIYQEIRIGRLHILKIGRRTVITADAAEEWLKRLSR